MDKHIADDLGIIAAQLNKTIGKFTEQEMEALFLEDETLNIDARLIVVELVAQDFSGGFGYNRYERTTGVVNRIQIELLRAGYKDTITW
jgi:hypothetical protein